MRTSLASALATTWCHMAAVVPEIDLLSRVVDVGDHRPFDEQ